MGSPSTAYDQPKEEMVEATVTEVATPIAPENPVKTQLSGLDPAVEDAYHTIGLALSTSKDLYDTFLNDFIQSMTQAQNGSSNVDSAMTVAKFAAKIFFDKWIATALSLPGKA